MRTAGIIAEYNPFHLGHAYHIKKARELSGADYVIVVMSPDYVQRGEPAIFDKYTRTKMALLCGADLVVQLPVCYATGSAEYFAEGSVHLLDALGVADVLCFGAEGPVPEDAPLNFSEISEEPYLDLAGQLSDESDTYRASLRENLRKGLTFPQARSASVKDPCGLLDYPNSSLGVEYCKALLSSGSSIRPLAIRRRGDDYGDDTPQGNFASALAIRTALRLKDSSSDPSAYIPEACTDLFEEAKNTPVFADDFLPFLIQKLLCSDRYEQILDISRDLSERIKNLRYDCIGCSFEEIVSCLQTKQFTKSRIRRALFHLILDIGREDLKKFRENGSVFYARILGFRESAAPLLHEMKKRSTVPLLSKTAQASELLDDTGLIMWEMDVAAAHLYQSILKTKYGIPFQTEYERSPVIY